MKKVKIMFLSITIFAIGAGALAFNAKIYGTWICTGPYAPGVTTCPELTGASTNEVTGDVVVLYTAKIQGKVVGANTDCESATNCVPIYKQDEP